jgi:hypothetical protein
MARFPILFLSLLLSLAHPTTVSASDHALLLHPPAPHLPRTATMEFSSLHRLPAAISVLALRRRPIRPLSSRHAITVVILALSGTIEVNPGPDLTLYSLNIRSLNHDHSIFLSDTLSEHPYDLIALTETWLSPKHTPAELIDLTPQGYDLLSCPRATGTGGGVAFLIRQTLSYHFSTFSSKSFEAISITVTLPKTSLTIFNVYRPPDSSSHTDSFGTFLKEFQTQLATMATTPHPFLITGDFNIHIENSANSHSASFLSLLNDANLTQHVHTPTHVHGHTLDLVISHSSLNPDVQCLTSTPSDHFPILTSLNIQSPEHVQPPSQPYRRIASIDPVLFANDITQSDIISNPPSSLHELIECYNSTLSRLLDQHAPLITKSRRTRPHPWYTPALHVLQLACRKAERVWKQTRSEVDRLALKNPYNIYYTAVKQAKQTFHSNLVTSSIGNPRKLWQTVNNILHRNKSSPLPMSSPTGTSLSSSFASYFMDKIDKLRIKISSEMPSNQIPNPHIPEPPSTPTSLFHFQPVTPDEITKIILSSPDKFCDLDPIPTSLLKKCISVLSPVITNIINLSLSSGSFPDNFKHSVIKPLLKKSNLDKESLSNYRPVSNLSFISKLTEKIVKIQLTKHLDCHSLFNAHQSAYTKSHSTETVLLSIHDYLIQAMGHQKVTGLCLLDLSAAFDTIDHQILLDRLSSWFGIGGSVLSWVYSYLTSRTFSVSTNSHLSPPSPVSYGVPQGSVLGPLLFIMYTTPLSHLIKTHNINHHLYADDTQLYIAIEPTDFHSASSILSSTFQAISHWMSSNMLALNPSKTEFLLIGTTQQLQKVTNNTLQLTPDTVLTPAKYAKNLGVIFDSNMSYHDHISAITKSCFLHIRDLRRIRPCLDYTTAANIATALVQSKLDYCNSLYIGLPKSELNRLQNIQNTLARVVANKRRHDHISPILESLHWLKLPERIHYKIIAMTYNILETAKPSYLSSLLTLQPPRSTRSSKLITLYQPSVTSYRAILNRSYSQSVPKLWNSLPPEMRTPKDPDSPGINSLSRKTFLAKLKTYLFQKSHNTKPSNSKKPNHTRPPD